MRPLVHFCLWAVGAARAETQTTLAEQACITRHAAGKQALAEIGAWHGFNTARIRNAMAEDGVLLAIDPYPVGRLGVSFQQIIAHREVARVASGTVRWMRHSGVDAARVYQATGGPLLDFLFIDGDHSYEGLRGDWSSWSPLIAPEGVVLLHDSRSSAERQIEDAGSVKFTREAILTDRRFEAVEHVDTLSVLRRRSSSTVAA